MEDQTLIDLYWSRDEAAIAQTAAKYGRLCSYIAGNILKSPEDCEECVNDSYLAVWNAIPTQRPERFSVFLSRITRNLALKARRIEAAISAFLRKLPEEKRVVFLRRYWYFDTIAAICRDTGSSESRVKSMLYHTRRKLREHLEREGIEL